MTTNLARFLESLEEKILHEGFGILRQRAGGKDGPATGQRTTRLPSSEVELLEGHDGNLLENERVPWRSPLPCAPVCSRRIRRGRAKRCRGMQRVQNRILEKGFTVSPRQECLRMVKGRKTKRKKERRTCQNLVIRLPRAVSRYYFQRVPFVERTPRIRVFRVTASRKARANALKIASAM